MSTTAIILVAMGLMAAVAGGSAYLVERRRRVRSELALRRAERARDHAHQELDLLTRWLADGASSHPQPDADGADGASRAPGGGVEGLSSDAFDPVSGLLDERFVAVLIQQRVAGARRRLHPVAVVALEADGVRGSDQPAIDVAMRCLGRVIRETLREADCACRVGDVVVIAALDDTTEEGARLAVERVQAGLRIATGDVGITVSAGIASYPTHALDAAELVARAGAALLDARSAGTSRVATASGEIRPT